MVKVGFCGLGHNGIAHMEAHQRVGLSGIVAVCDRNPERLEETAKRFGVKRAYTSAGELCADPDVEAVSINTGDPFHVEPFVAAVSHGKHVLVEKPIGNSVEEIETMVRAAQEAPSTLKLAAGYILRFDPVFEDIHAAATTGKLGQITYMEGDYIHNLLYQAKQTDTLTGRNWYLEEERPLTGGGTHPLDLMRWFSGGQCVEVTGFSNGIAFPAMQCDDCQVVLFKLDTGAIAKVACLYAPRMDMAPHYNVRVYGTKGTVYGDKIAISKNEDDVHPEFVPMGADAAIGHPYDPEIKDWLEAITDDRPPRCDFFDGANSSAACLVAHEAIAQGRTLPIKVYARP